MKIFHFQRPRIRLAAAQATVVIVMIRMKKFISAGAPGRRKVRNSTTKTTMPQTAVIGKRRALAMLSGFSNSGKVGRSEDMNPSPIRSVK